MANYTKAMIMSCYITYKFTLYLLKCMKYLTLHCSLTINHTNDFFWRLKARTQIYSEIIYILCYCYFLFFLHQNSIVMVECMALLCQK